MNPETKFIWAFVAPVILITLINVAFFIKAATVMWKLSRRRYRLTGNVKHAKTWLKAVLSLVVVMGLTWIFGILIVEAEEMAFLAYIYTFLVAFQGVWIFLLFVIFDRQVREDYAKLWGKKVKFLLSTAVVSKRWPQCFLNLFMLSISLQKGQHPSLKHISYLINGNTIINDEFANRIERTDANLHKNIASKLSSLVLLIVLKFKAPILL